MKKVIYLILFLFINFCVFSSSWPTGVKVALEMENNLSNSGNGPYSFSNNGPTPFSKHHFLEGVFSLGIIDGVSQYVYGNQDITDIIQTIQFSFWQPTSGVPDACYLLASTTLYVNFNIFQGALYYGDISINYISTGIPFSKAAWHTIKATYNGTGVTIYRDMTPVVTHVAHQPTGDTFVIGSHPSGNAQTNGYIDNVLFSTDNSGDGIGIPTINGPTYTPTITPTPNRKQTIIAGTKTKIAILSQTPTAVQSVVMCAASFPVVFQQNPTPILVPTTTYEGGTIGTGGCVLEPNVILGPDGKFHMTYSANAFYHGGLVEVLGLAIAPNPWGPWTRYGTTPIIGGGYGGVAEPCGQSSQYKIGSEYRIYFSGLTSRHVFYSSSTDGYNYTFVATPVIMSSAFNPPCTGGAGLDGMGIVYDGTDYWSLAEINANTCPGLSSYALWICKGNSTATSFVPASSVALSGLNPFHPAVHLYAGGRSTIKIGKNYHTWTHVDVPSNIYHGQSKDLFNWKTDLTPVVQYSNNMFGLISCNQAADTSIIEYSGKTYLYYDGTDNANGEGAIGYSVYPGTLAQYDACFNPTATNEITNTVAQ